MLTNALLYIFMQWKKWTGMEGRGKENQNWRQGEELREVFRRLLVYNIFNMPVSTKLSSFYFHFCERSTIDDIVITPTYHVTYILALTYCMCKIYHYYLHCTRIWMKWPNSNYLCWEFHAVKFSIWILGKQLRKRTNMTISIASPGDIVRFFLIESISSIH